MCVGIVYMIHNSGYPVLTCGSHVGCDPVLTCGSHVGCDLLFYICIGTTTESW